MRVAKTYRASAFAAFFLIAVLAYAAVFAGNSLAFYVILASGVAGYMALTIGANDVANYMGPVVGAKALTMTGAIAIAAICEAAGALLAGGDVVETVSRDIIGPSSIPAVDFILLMTAGLLAAAMWIHLATYLGAPVSTTHAIIGGVLGAGFASAGPDVVSWTMVGMIALGWAISPVIGGAGAAACLALVGRLILNREDRIAAARTWVPVLIAAMAGTFAVYLASKGLARVWSASAPVVVLVGVIGAVAAWMAARPWVRLRAQALDDRPRNIATLFSLPLVFAAALMAFAHGANDVANAVGPLAAIIAAARSGAAAAAEVSLPLWALAIGAVGISAGLGLFGKRLIRSVGEITRLNAVHAFCVLLTTAIIVLLASTLGMPVSSTHIAIGAIFGVGFLREYVSNQSIPNPAIQPRTRFLEVSALNATPQDAVARARKRERRRLVRRRQVIGIVSAWIVTMPATALLAGVLYLMLDASIGG